MEGAYIQKARMLMEQGRIKDAIPLLYEELSVSPDSFAARYLLGSCAIATGQMDLARDTLKGLLASHPDSDIVAALASHYHDMKDNSKKAMEWIDRAIALDPMSVSHLGDKAELLYEAYEFEQALDFANRGLEIDPQDIDCLNIRAKALTKLNRKTEAFKTIDNALNQDPDNPNTHANHGWSQLEIGDHKKALTHFMEALKLNPNHAYAKAGMLEALKARYLLYRWFLKYQFWIGNMKPNARWGIIIGMYLGYRFLHRIKASMGEWEFLVTPILVLYMIFALSSWIINPLVNLLLRLHPIGKYALEEDERRMSTFVGISLGVGLLAGIGYWMTGLLPLAFLGIFGGTMMIPLGSMLKPRDPKARNYLIIAASALGLFGILGILGVAGPWVMLYIYGFIGYQFFANYQMAK